MGHYILVEMSYPDERRLGEVKTIEEHLELSESDTVT